MPAFYDQAVSALREAQPELDPEGIIKAARVGCTDSEIAGLLGVSPQAFDRLLTQDPGLRSRLEALRAERRFLLRKKVQDITQDDSHPAQGRILDRVLVGEIQAEVQEEVQADSWVAIMKLARLDDGSKSSEPLTDSGEGADDWDL